MTVDRKRLTKILVRAEKDEVAALAANIRNTYKPVIVKEPAKTLAMVKLKDPVRQGRFFLGEVIVYEATVEIDGVKGIAVMMGEDADKVLDMAIIDAAVNMGVFYDVAQAEELEKKQNRRIMQEQALILQTMVNFESMDQEAPDDLNAFKEA